MGGGPFLKREGGREGEREGGREGGEREGENSNMKTILQGL